MEILVRSERAEGWTAKSGGEKVPHGPLARVPSNPIFGAGSTPNPPLGKVREEATDEDLGHRRGLFAMAGAETRLLRIDMKQARIGQCDAMGIAAKIRKDLFRSAKGSLGLDDPGFAVEAVSTSCRRSLPTDKWEESTAHCLVASVLTILNRRFCGYQLKTNATIM